MRFFRFHAEYAETDPDPEGLAASGAERQGLVILSKERIRHELLKLLVARRAEDTIRILADHGFLTWILGGAAEFGRFGRVAAYDKIAPIPIWRLAALAVMVEEDAERLRERLRLSNDEHKKLSAYARILCLLKTWAMPLDAAAIRRLAADHVPKGPKVGEMLAQARQAWLAEGCRTDEAYAKGLLIRVMEQA
jgi:poly(A) polymerase